ncbi:MAG: hypothetical protein QXI58_00505 [Candidatus Micrarchaeia archaeon]
MKVSDIPEEILAYRIERTKYPSPFLDIATLALNIPKQDVDKFCWLVSILDPIIGPIIRKLAKYAITQILVDTTDSELKDAFEHLINKIELQNHLIQIGLDYHTYGNAFVSILYPFRRFFRCDGCNNNFDISQIKNITQLSYKKDRLVFIGYCPFCKTKRTIEIITIRNSENLRLANFNNEVKLIHWAPPQIDIEYIPSVNFSIYYYTLSKTEKNMILQGNPYALKYMHEEFIKAALKGKKLEITTMNMFHFKFPTPTSVDFFPGWGLSPILNVIKLVYYAQILRKANEVIAWEHILPLRLISPNPQFGPVNFEDFRRKIATVLKRWKLDPGVIGIVPVPFISTLIGGEGKALNLTPEIINTVEQIITGMEVPRELVFGGLSWSSSLVALRMLENYFMNYTYQLQHFFDFFVDHIKRIYKITTEVKLRFKTFRRADDIQYLHLLIGLNQAQLISKETLMDIIGFDYEKERDKLKKEMIKLVEDSADVDAEAKKQQAKVIDKVVDEIISQWLARAAQEAGYSIIDIERLIDYWTYQLLQRPKEDQEATLEYLKQNMPNVYEAIITKLIGLQQIVGAEAEQFMAEKVKGSQKEAIELESVIKKQQKKREKAVEKPLPEKKPPRRHDEII